MRDFIKELDAVSTGFRGYDKEEIMLYIKDLLQYCEEEKKKDMNKLIEQSASLRKELDEAKSREANQKSQYEALLEKFEKLSEAVGENARHNADRDTKLDEFYRKQDEIDNLLETTRNTAAVEKKKLLEDTKEQCLKLLAQAELEKQKILDQAKADGQELYNKAIAENSLLLEKNRYLRNELEQMAEKLKPILFPGGAGQSGDKSRRDTAAGTQAEGLISK